MEFENLLRLVEAVSRSELTGLKYEENGVKVQLTKKRESVQAIATPLSEEEGNAMREKHTVSNSDSDETDKYQTVKSPLVGTFYAAPSETAEAFVNVGSVVKKGQTLGIVEAMKLMNEIDSEFDGIVEEILVKNGDTVEYGQPLFRIR